MHSFIDPNIPIVAIFNNREISAWELKYIEDSTSVERLANYNHSVGDRAVLWLGASKLVVVSAPLPQAETLKLQLGYSATQVAFPNCPSQFLCLDILNEPALIQHLLDYVGPNKTVQLIPYSATPQFFQLVTALETKYDLNVVLPESPDQDCLWLKNYVDTKAGFRHLVSHCLPDAERRLPEGFICENLEQIISIVRWFHAQNRSCILKPNHGWDGVGLAVFHPNHSVLEDELQLFQLHPALQENLTVFEEYIHAASAENEEDSLPLFPSAEFFVPRSKSEKPEITHICNQILKGRFGGLTINRRLWEQSWSSSLVESGLRIANYLQQKGYVGHFDLDAVVDKTGEIRLLEVNPRRTGSTHIHELACFLFGSDYINHAALLSQCSVDSGAIDTYELLEYTLNDLLYTHEKRQGIVLINTSSLIHHKFGYVIIAPTHKDATLLQEQLFQRMQISSD